METSKKNTQLTPCVGIYIADYVTAEVFNAILDIFKNDTLTEGVGFTEREFYHDGKHVGFHGYMPTDLYLTGPKANSTKVNV